MSSKPRDLVRVVGVSAAHHGRWQELYRAYGEFYQAPITPEALRETWRWLLDPAHPLLFVLRAAMAALLVMFVLIAARAARR